MRTSDFSFLVLSSIVFQVPAGDADCAKAGRATPAARQAATSRRVESFMVGVRSRSISRMRSEQGGIEVHHRRRAGAGAPDQGSGLGQQLGEVEARRLQLGDVERIA